MVPMKSRRRRRRGVALSTMRANQGFAGEEKNGQKVVVASLFFEEEWTTLAKNSIDFGEDVGQEEIFLLLDDVVDTCPVPMDQRPSQLKEVAEGLVSGWGGLDGKSYGTVDYFVRVFFTVIAY